MEYIKARKVEKSGSTLRALMAKTPKSDTPFLVFLEDDVKVLRPDSGVKSSGFIVPKTVSSVDGYESLGLSRPTGYVKADSLVRAISGSDPAPGSDVNKTAAQLLGFPEIVDEFDDTEETASEDDGDVIEGDPEGGVDDVAQESDSLTYLVWVPAFEGSTVGSLAGVVVDSRGGAWVPVGDEVGLGADDRARLGAVSVPASELPAAVVGDAEVVLVPLEHVVSRPGENDSLTWFATQVVLDLLPAVARSSAVVDTDSALFGRLARALGVERARAAGLAVLHGVVEVSDSPVSPWGIVRSDAVEVVGSRSVAGVVSFVVDVKESEVSRIADEMKNSMWS